MGIGKPANSLRLLARRRESDEYLWHLAKPWSDWFSHDHWWGQDANSIPAAAAIWEILRRHPFAEWMLVGGMIDWEFEGPPGQWSKEEWFVELLIAPNWRKRRTQFLDILRKMEEPGRGPRMCCHEYDLILAAHGDRTWQKLPESQKRWWKESLERMDPQHGFCPQPLDEDEPVEVIPDPGTLDRTSVRDLKRAAKLFQNGESTALDSFLKKHRFEGAIRNALGSNQITISFDPHTRNIERIVKKRVKEVVGAWAKKFPKQTRNTYGRWRVQDWLGVIAAFESAEETRGRSSRRDDQLFARYRRIIGAWSF